MFISIELLSSIDAYNTTVLNFDTATGSVNVWGWHHKDAIQWTRYGGKTIRRVLREAGHIGLPPLVYDQVPAWAKEFFYPLPVEERIVLEFTAMQECLEIIGPYWSSWVWAMVPCAWDTKEEEAEGRAHLYEWELHLIEEERRNDARLYA